jgi:Uma2 family endonuclease
MGEPRRHHRYTYAEYVALETYSDVKHEFLDGDIYAMAGGSRNHAALAIAIASALLNAVRGGSCTVQGSDLRIYVEAGRLATFPDVSVICGPIQLHPAGPQETALHPMILVEVTSDSSEEYDLGEKREFYQTIPTLREYIIVSHRERRITVHAREGDGWTSRISARGDRFAAPSLETDIAVDDIYANSTVA